jgi:hypothetical protein
MRASVLLAVAPAMLFVGCTHTVKEERVVEKPVSSPTVERETVVERQVPAPPVVVERHVQTSPRSCLYSGTSYSSGSISCQANLQYRCDDGLWQGLNAGC